MFVRIFIFASFFLFQNFALAADGELKNLKRCQNVAKFPKVKAADKQETECVKEMQLAMSSIQEFLRHCNRYGLKVRQDNETIRQITSSGHRAQEYSNRARTSCNSAIKKLNEAIPEMKERNVNACANEMSRDIKSIKDALKKLEA